MTYYIWPTGNGDHINYLAALLYIRTGNVDFTHSATAPRINNDHFRVIVASNFRFLQAANLPAYEAALVSLLRAQFVKLGLYVSTLNARSMHVDEIGAEPNATPDDILTDLRGAGNGTICTENSVIYHFYFC